jgi:hypothetical protein
VTALTAFHASVAAAQSDWNTTAEAWKGRVGATFSIYCPPTQTPGGTVWGSIVYTDDSSVCQAAMHTLLGFDHTLGGTVYFTMEPGRGAYDADVSRGVAVTKYDNWDGSFRIVGAYAGRTPAQITDTSAMEITWSTTARHWRGLDSLQRVVICPAARSAGLIWGIDVYADSSAICPAAVHAGIIKLSGGGVTLRIEPGREFYRAARRNGVRSDSTDVVLGSFTFPKEQVKVARLVQGRDAVPSGREGMLVEAVERPASPAAQMPPQERTGEYVLTWSLNASAWRGQTGGMITMYCPPNGEAGRLWGAGEYTDDSSVCTAAVHSLATFDFQRGGTVFMTMTAGRDAYAGESRRGLTSTAWERFESSFRIVGGVAGLTPNQVKDSTVVEISWATTAQHLRGKTGERRFVCPGDRQAFPVWGSDVYTDQSSICNAAVHAGVITAEGGPVAVKLEPGRKDYQAATRNEIATQSFGSGQGSFSVHAGATKK